jgi:hypothetical protein
MYGAALSKIRSYSVNLSFQDGLQKVASKVFFISRSYTEPLSAFVSVRFRHFHPFEFTKAPRPHDSEMKTCLRVTAVLGVETKSASIDRPHDRDKIKIRVTQVLSGHFQEMVEYGPFSAFSHTQQIVWRVESGFQFLLHLSSMGSLQGQTKLNSLHTTFLHDIEH